VGLAIFDLDNTLLNGDSDYLWGQFLVDQGIVDREYYESTNADFYADYRQGTLNIFEFLNFALAPLATHELKQLHKWRDEFIQEKIKPIVLPAAAKLVGRHRDTGDTLLVITATNKFVTEPIVSLYGIDNLLATVPEMIDGRYTGQVDGIPCFQDGKVKQLDAWLEKTGLTLHDSWFYSDSLNDLPLLEKVNNPVAVDPDETLERVAREKHWPIISLRSEKLPGKKTTGR
jgi:HAD superfamily hydrolase (TIGR01490 family)